MATKLQHENINIGHFVSEKMWFFLIYFKVVNGQMMTPAGSYFSPVLHQQWCSSL
jgi:hypothetical protein